MKKTISIQKVARNTIDIQVETVTSLYESINDSFSQAVNAIDNCVGRVVVTGIGKSAIIGQKYVSTFNSTGTPAIFLHAADAVHGDVGTLQKEDILICISKSGTTPEIKVLIPLIKQFGNKIICVVANQDSFLAQHADYVIYTPINQEADPNNLAPTASTTAQLVIGDAIAVCLLALKGFDQNDFAQYHPGGSLGKQLYLTCGDLVDSKRRPQVNLNQSVKEVIMEISGNRLGATVVMDQNEVVGIITDGDLRRMLNKQTDWNKFVAKDIMNEKPKSIQKKSLAIKALNQMKEHSISQLIVKDEEDYFGIVHLHDIVKEGIL